MWGERKVSDTQFLFGRTEMAVQSPSSNCLSLPTLRLQKLTKLIWGKAGFTDEGTKQSRAKLGM